MRDASLTGGTADNPSVILSIIPNSHNLLVSTSNAIYNVQHVYDGPHGDSVARLAKL